MTHCHWFTWETQDSDAMPIRGLQSWGQRMVLDILLELQWHHALWVRPGLSPDLQIWVTNPCSCREEGFASPICWGMQKLRGIDVQVQTNRFWSLDSIYAGTMITLVLVFPSSVIRRAFISLLYLWQAMNLRQVSTSRALGELLA